MLAKLTSLYWYDYRDTEMTIDMIICDNLQTVTSAVSATFFNIDGLVQERPNSIALAMELRLSCTNPSIWCSNPILFWLICINAFVLQVKASYHEIWIVNMNQLGNQTHSHLLLWRKMNSQCWHQPSVSASQGTIQWGLPADWWGAALFYNTMIFCLVTHGTIIERYWYLQDWGNIMSYPIFALTHWYDLPLFESKLCSHWLKGLWQHQNNSVAQYYTLPVLASCPHGLCNNGCKQKSYDTYPDSKVHGANMGPTWVLSAPDGPHVGPKNLAIRVLLQSAIHSNTMMEHGGGPLILATDPSSTMLVLIVTSLITNLHGFYWDVLRASYSVRTMLFFCDIYCLFNVLYCMCQLQSLWYNRMFMFNCERPLILHMAFHNAPIIKWASR